MSGAPEDPFLDLASAVQALRRRIERLRCVVGGGLGVAAQSYPHQVLAVNRVLTAPRVRHLLADEVGLGKSVQALMVINALRLQQGDAARASRTEPSGFKVLVVVPDSLVAQWRDELMGRAHEAPTEAQVDKPGPDSSTLRLDETRLTTLAWPRVISSLSLIDPARFEMLVVDEIHNLPLELRDHIGERAREFRHLVALTATPRFSDVSRFVELLSLLEPERMTVAEEATIRRVGDTALRRELPRKWPVAAQRALVGELLGPEVRAATALEANDWCDLPPPPARAAAVAAAERWSSRRRILRARRVELERLLPPRTHTVVVAEPTADERRRLEVVWDFLGRAKTERPRIDGEALARRALLGGASLRVRAAALARGDDIDQLMRQVATLCSPSAGDSRGDALCDLLMDVWSNNPDEQVLIAAYDAATVDHTADLLRARLPEVGPPSARRSLLVATIRTPQDGALEDLAGTGSAVQEQLREFASGRAQVLVAGEVAQFGLNLQRARVLVFSAPPWSLDEVEQWIGRVDRLGYGATARDHRPVPPVRVFTIVQRGQRDEVIAELLERSGVYGANLDLVDAQRERTRAAILEVGLGHRPEICTAAAESETADLLRAPLAGHLPLTAKEAWRLLDIDRERGAVPPRLLEPEGRFTAQSARERALEGWVELLRRTGDYSISGLRRDALDRDFRFRTMAYRFEERGLGRTLRTRPALILERGLGPNPRPEDVRAERLAAFFTRRLDLQQPPKLEVEFDGPRGQVKRPLTYLDHGALLHEDLVNAWESLAPALSVAVEVEFPRRHPAIEHCGEGVYVVSVAWVDAGQHLLPPPDEQALATGVADGSVAEATFLVEVLRQLRAAHRADARWLRALLPAELIVLAERRTKESADLLTPDAAMTLLRPFASALEPWGHGNRWDISAPPFPQDFLGSAQVQAGMNAELLRRWADPAKELDDALARRLYVIEGEHVEAVAAAALEVERARAFLADQSAEATSRPLFEARLRRAVARAELVRRVGEARLEWLRAIPDRIRQVRPRPFKVALMHVRASPAPEPLVGSEDRAVTVVAPAEAVSQSKGSTELASQARSEATGEAPAG